LGEMATIKLKIASYIPSFLRHENKIHLPPNSTGSRPQ
jgi:hypothetical protein